MTGPAVRLNSSDAALAKLVDRLGPDPLDLAGIKKFGTKLTRELGHLPDPYFDDAEELFAWKVLAASEQVVMIARTSIPRAGEALAAAEKYFGINREELNELRFEIYELIEAVYLALQTPNLPEASQVDLKKKLGRYLEGQRAFTAMCRYFVCDVWKLLPRPLN